jgi:hypothetical protein
MTSKRTLWLSISQVVAFGIAAIAFLYWAPWTASITAEEAARRFPGQIDPSWRAVHVNHGVANEWRLGTPKQNPVPFALCTVALFGGVSYAVGVALVRQMRKDERDSV